METSDNYVDFKRIKEYINISNPKTFLEYLREIFRDLSTRTDTHQKDKIQKISFIDYLKLSVFFSEKLFASFDDDQDGQLSLDEFLTGMRNLYCGNFEETLTQVFKLLDFDRDGIITKEDTKLFLSNLPLKDNKSKSSSQYKHQMDSLTEIETVVNQTFSKYNKLNFTEFCKVVEKRKGDVYIQILCFLYQNKPFNEETFSSTPVFTKRNSQEIKNNLKVQSPIINKRIPSPRKSNLSPVMKLLSDSNRDSKSTKSANSIGNETEYEYEEMVRLLNKRMVQSNSYNVNTIIKESKHIFNSPSKILRKKSSQKMVSDFTLESNLIPLEDPNEHQTKTQKEKNKIYYEGKLLRLDNKDKTESVYAVLDGQDILFYSNEQKENFIEMKHLTGYYIKPTFKKIISNEILYAFQLQNIKEKFTFIHKDKNAIQQWCKNIKDTLGYLNFFDYYEIQKEIGHGEFGEVKLGIHKKTGAKVAIKIIKKETMQSRDIQLVKYEIDIMKLCHHPNVVSLLDHFENTDYIFIIMEYLSGGDLQQYLELKDFLFNEKQVAKLIRQIAEGIKYLQKFGIIHRDLKPENIMLSDKSEDPIIKIMDFGLGVIAGPKEKIEDGYGTLDFVAPEILVRSPYNKEVDIWSLGIILFYMLSGILPFDDDSGKEEVIGKKIVLEDLKFDKDFWDMRTGAVKDLIAKCLNKKKEERIKINEFLSHPWFSILK